MSADKRPPYHRRQTRPKQRAALAPVPASVEVDPDKVETKVPCPTCGGSGMVSASELATPVLAERRFDVVGEDEDNDGYDG